MKINNQVEREIKKGETLIIAGAFDLYVGGNNIDYYVGSIELK